MFWSISATARRAADKTKIRKLDDPVSPGDADNQVNSESKCGNNYYIPCGVPKSLHLHMI